jgi:signal transduction histidine kinase
MSSDESDRSSSSSSDGKVTQLFIRAKGKITSICVRLHVPLLGHRCGHSLHFRFVLAIVISPLRFSLMWRPLAQRKVRVRRLMYVNDNPDLPNTILNYCWHSKRTLSTALSGRERLSETCGLTRDVCSSFDAVAVMLNDAAEDMRFKDDIYVSRRRPRSVLCAPLSLKSKHHGMIYLENDMRTGVFGEDRLQLLNILTGQLMNTLENASLADELRRANHRMQRKNKRLEEMDSAKDNFLAVASHELRTPLTGISGMAGLMEDTEMTAYQEECLADIQAESETLLELVNDVLDLSKLKARKVSLVRNTITHAHARTNLM